MCVYLSVFVDVCAYTGVGVCIGICAPLKGFLLILRAKTSSFIHDDVFMWVDRVQAEEDVAEPQWHDP